MHKRYDYIYTIKAQEDLKNITDYIAYELYNEKAAYDFVDELERTIDYICDYPLSMPHNRNKKLATKGIRYAMVNNYKLHYTVDAINETINLLYIKHSLQKDSN